MSPPLGYERQDGVRQKTILLETFAGVGWEVPHVLEEMWSARDFYFVLIAQVRMEHWTQGRVALLGHTGYCPSAVTGLGTSLALVGAYVLAGELARSPARYDRACARYESVMREYVRQCQQLPPGGLDGMLPRRRRGIWIRNLSMRMMTRWPMRTLVAGQFHKAEAIALEDYAMSSRSIAPPTTAER